MRSAIIMVSIFLGHGSTEPPEPACRACIHGFCYVKNEFLDITLMLMDGIPAFDLTENILYFNSEETPYYAVIPKDLNYYVSKQMVPGLPQELMVGNTVDQKTRQLYTWRKHSDEYNIYPLYVKNCSFVYDPIKEKVYEVHATEDAIKQMHFKNKLYYTLKFKNGLFKHDFDSIIPAFDGYNISQFVLDRLEDVYATTANGVYRLKRGADQVTLLTPKNYSVIVDKDENVYFMDQIDKTVLKLDYHTDHIVEVGAFASYIKDFLFDKYNRILVAEAGPSQSEFTNWIFTEPKGGCRITVDREGKKEFVKVSDSLWQGLERLFANLV